MEFSLFWLAVKGKSPDVVRAELLLRATGEREEVPQSPVTGIELSGGWYVVLESKCMNLGAPSVLARLSQVPDVVACFVEEHVMASEVSQWAGGKRVWHIGHQSDQGIMHLDAVGQLPSCFEELRTSHMAHQRDDTDGDVPVRGTSRGCPNPLRLQARRGPAPTRRWHTLRGP